MVTDHELILQIALQIKVLWGIFGRIYQDLTTAWTKSHNSEIHSICSSPNIVRVIKSWRMRKGHVECTREIRMHGGYQS
jgi:hypothetical protein